MTQIMAVTFANTETFMHNFVLRGNTLLAKYNDILFVVGALSGIASVWGYSSAGRALAWHARGHRFDPAYLHQHSAKLLVRVPFV